jgi:hypothetical protein
VGPGDVLQIPEQGEIMIAKSDGTEDERCQVLPERAPPGFRPVDQHGLLVPLRRLAQEDVAAVGIMVTEGGGQALQRREVGLPRC